MEKPLDEHQEIGTNEETAVGPSNPVSILSETVDALVYLQWVSAETSQPTLIWKKQNRRIKVLNGSLELNVLGKSRLINEGDVAFVGRNTSHTYRSIGSAAAVIEVFVWPPQQTKAIPFILFWRRVFPESSGISKHGGPLPSIKEIRRSLRTRRTGCVEMAVW